MQGDPYAITAVGIMFFRGEGGAPKLPSEAVRLYLIAADMGYAPAQYNYSAALALGQGVAKNDSESLKYWRAAYDQGYPPALSGSPTDLASGRNHKPLSNRIQNYSAPQIDSKRAHDDVYPKVQKVQDQNGNSRKVIVPNPW